MKDDIEVVVQEALEDNFQYLVIRDAKAVAIDPAESGPLVAVLTARGLSLEAILLTHDHWDHVCGVADLAGATGARIYGPSGLSGVAVDVEVDEERPLHLLDCDWKPLATPGHCSIHFAYALPAAEAVFTGDALFAGGCGRLFGNPPAWMAASLDKLAGLPERWTVYGGHDYVEDNLGFAQAMEPENAALNERAKASEQEFVPSTLAEEKATNPFLRCREPALRNAVGLPEGNPVEVFTALRAKKDAWR